MAKDSGAAPISNAAILVAPSLTPVVLSDEEKEFRFGLRTFVLSSLQEQADAFGQITGRLVNTDSNTVFIKDRESTVAAGILLDSLLHMTYFPSWLALSDQANTTVEAMDTRAVMEKAKAYFRSYNESKVYFQKFLLLAGFDPTKKGLLSHWIDVDARAAQAFNNLVTSPLTGEFAHSGFLPASNRFAIYLTAPTNESLGK